MDKSCRYLTLKGNDNQKKTKNKRTGRKEEVKQVAGRSEREAERTREKNIFEKV